MGSAPMNTDGSGDTNLVEQNNQIWDEKKGVGSIVVGEVQGLGSSEEDEPRTNGVVEEIKNGSDMGSQGPTGPPKLQPQGPVVNWQRFLPFGSLKVLLVENDDSTRHVVSALLRNCSYEVTSVANGLQAWRILQDLSNHYDLVLTEVVMPFVSGVGLLCKIMSHKTLKNIPVIMMSSRDSMGLVFKCLSKGAVDFLVKPIRKNELKNLWQHVWRRCQSSSGSGSESGTQARRSGQSKRNDESENNTGSSDEHENGSIGMSIRDGSDNGSGTQSSWTKRAAEIDSPRPISLWDQLVDAPDSTCAQVILTKHETTSSHRVHVTETKEFLEQDEQLDNNVMGKDLEIGICRGIDSELGIHPQGNERHNKLAELERKEFEKDQMEIKREDTADNGREEAAKLTGVVSSCNDQQVESRAFDDPIDLADISQMKDKPSTNIRELPSLELTLKRVRGAADVEIIVHNDINVLKHSGLSAFSKYTTAFPAAYQAPTGIMGSCSPLNNGSVIMKTETMQNSICTPPNQQSNGSSNNDDMASTSKYISKPEPPNDKSESTSALKCSQSSAFQPIQNGHTCAQQLMPGKEIDVAVGEDQVQAQGSNQPVQVQHHHHHYHHYHHHVHNMEHQHQLDHSDVSLKNMESTALQCGSSNMVGGPLVGNAEDYSVNGSASGSNHGSNGQNGSSNAVNAGMANKESYNGVAGNSQVGGTSGQISGIGADEDRFAQREAALTKFRQKRKERCFEKKVRYQSRKKLAEQRPRIRGQFVRQIGSDNKEREEKQDNMTGDGNSSDSVQ